ncbi:MAG: segregation/condensation protein A [bacterium]|nr:segregation/condensation protein A [bacterium]
MRYEIKSDQFTGPLDKLLELIEERKMEITVVNLAEITNDFLKYLQSINEETTHPSVIADFIIVASKLLLIKSKALLPSLELTPEEENDIQDLELRLKIYKEFSARGGSALGGKNAALNLKTLWDNKKYCFGKELFADLPPIFYPPKNLEIKDLIGPIEKIITELKALIPEKKTVKKIVISIKEKMEELLNRFKQKAENSFKNVVESKSKLEIIVFFLAILHLIRDRLITSTQEDQFSDIIIKQKPKESEPLLSGEQSI